MKWLLAYLICVAILLTLWANRSYGEDSELQ